MGPWAIRDESNPFRPGCSYETVKMLVARRRIVAETVIRGPSTRQFWMRASNVPGVAHLLGECHACHKPSSAAAAACTSCGASFAVEDDRQYLGLAEVRLVPDSGTQRVQAPLPRRDATMRRPASATPIGELIPEEADAPPPLPKSAALEPVRSPIRSSGSHEPLDDAQIDALLRRGRADERMKRSTGVVVAVVAIALAGILGMGGYVVYVLTSGGAGQGGQAPGK